ncbi:MAG TPA: ATP-binding protein [Bryobacteraceae bacterium]|nr:ATP-binding protein [Bryobacteraceae bacterium]
MRFRLTASYALIFALLLIGVAALVRERLAASLDNQVHEVLNQEWAAMKGYLRIERNRRTGKVEPYWYYDREDPDESLIVRRIQRVYLATDADGNVLESSTAYQDIGVDPPSVVQERVREATPKKGSTAMASAAPETGGKVFWTEKRDPQGAPYLIRSSIVWDEGHHAPYYVAIGMALSDNRGILRDFTAPLYEMVIPAALILGSLLGWFMAGRALAPVLGVARTAQRISGSNLSLRIPTRQAGDELDYLILTFNRMIERLEASFQQMKQFSADVSHELRTPITGIRGQLEVALFTAKSTEQYREAMFNALQDIDRLSQIVRALLLLSQAESGQLVLQKSHVDLSQLVQELVEQFQIPAEAAAVQLTADLPPSCSAYVDRVQIERMLTNLLSNGIKFTPEGGSVRISLQSFPERIEMVVEDTGCGIPTEHLPHIFDRFYRVPGTGTAPSPEQGLGLGLSFVDWIVRAHRGKIHVDSTPGAGTRFTIKLPPGSASLDTVELSGQSAAL